MKQIRNQLTYANLMSSLAVFLVLGGATALAATKIGSNEIKANAITTGKIRKEAVTEGIIKAGAVGNSRLGDGSVTATKLAGNAVLGSAIADNAVTSPKLADNAVSGSKLSDNAVTTGKLADAAVTPAKLSEPYLPAATVGVPVAGANISETGEVRKFFNRAGGSPSVSHVAASGRYVITFPGLEGQAFFNNSVVLATLDGSAGEISRGSVGGNPSVFTWSSAGVPTEAAFEIVIVVPGRGAEDQ